MRPQDDRRGGCAAILFLCLVLGFLGYLTADSDHPAPPKDKSEQASEQPPPMEAAADVASDKSSISTGDTVSMTGNSVGCADIDDLSKIKEALVVQNDSVSALKIAKSSGCPLKRKGSEGLVSDTSFMHDAFCIHFMGEPGCIWLPKSAFEKK